VPELDVQLDYMSPNGGSTWFDVTTNQSGGFVLDADPDGGNVTLVRVGTTGYDLVSYAATSVVAGQLTLSIVVGPHPVVSGTAPVSAPTLDALVQEAADGTMLLLTVGAGLVVVSGIVQARRHRRLRPPR